MAEELFQSLGKSRFFSKIDLRAGYFQLPIAPGSQDYTAFWWGTSLYKYVRVPFGLKQAPAAFQRVMDLELGGAGCSGFTKTFIDDILVHSETFEDHIKHLRAVFTVLHRCGLRAHPEKTQLLIDTVDFLGYDVSEFGMTPQEAKIKGIMDLTWPKDVPELRTKLGVLQYYSCFCPNFSARVRPLTQLLCKNVPWEWKAEVHGAAFDDVRKEICTPGKGLRRFDVDRPTFVHTDFSNRGLGGVLAQVDVDSNEYIVACASRSLNKAEANYSSYKGECLAAVWACKLFQHYTHGLHFTLVTDHEPLKWLMTTNNLQGTHARWACQLQEHSFTIMHRPGASHQNADALSRYPQPSSRDDTGARMDHDEDPSQLVATVAGRLVDRVWRYYEEVKMEIRGAVDRYQVEGTLAASHSGPPRPNGVRNTAALDRTDQGHLWKEMDSAGVILYEPCGGLCAGLEALLSNGVKVHKYLYSDISAGAIRVARHRVQQLQQAYPTLLSTTAIAHTFSALPMDVHEVGMTDLILAGAESRLQWVVIAGPECQDFSPAGGSRGWGGVHAETLRSCINIIGFLQQLQRERPPLWLLENAALQHNWRSKGVRENDYATVCSRLGAPVRVDAPSFGSYAHRMRNFWTNMGDQEELAKFIRDQDPGVGWGQVDDILDEGRYSTSVEKSDATPFYPSNVKGEPRAALPTLVAYPMSRAFRVGQPGAIYDRNLGMWTEPNVEERERALGYPTGATAAPGVSREERHVVTGNCIDQRVLAGLIRGLLRQQGKGEQEHSRVVLAAVPRRDTAARQEVYQGPPLRHTYVSDLALTLSYEGYDNPPVEQEVPAAPTELSASVKVFNLNRRLTRRATESEREIWKDQPVLVYLQTGRIPDSCKTPVQIRRVLRRGSAYRWDTTAPSQPLRRAMANGSLRVVPRPVERGETVHRCHVMSGHFGIRRTLHLVMAAYWWQGMEKDVTTVVTSCSVCDRVKANFDRPAPELSPHPICGLFYAWGVDTSGPYLTSHKGNKYVMHAMEYFSSTMVLEPMPNKESKSTAYAFLHGVLSRFGGCAQVVTDGGGEYEGAFAEMLAHNFIDHRVTSASHPQANGLTERSVATVKKGLLKHCESIQHTGEWDLKLPYLALGYNCSRQMSTNCSPFELVYARAPTFPTAAGTALMSAPLEMDTEQQRELAAASMVERARYLEQALPIVANNLAIAHHRDTLWYARRRGGAFLPQVKKYSIGDYVYVRRRHRTNMLQVVAKQVILRVLDVRTKGTLVLQGRCGCTVTAHTTNVAPCHLPCMDGTLRPELARPPVDFACEICNHPDDGALMVLCSTCGTGWHIYCLQPPLTSIPEGDWRCPICVSRKVTLPPPMRQPVQQPEPVRRQPSARSQERSSRHDAAQGPRGDNPYHTTAEANADAQAQAWDGRVVCQPRQTAEGQDMPKWGTLVFRGARYRPEYFEIQYTDGTRETATLRSLRGSKWQVLPEGSDLPAVNVVGRGVRCAPPCGHPYHTCDCP